MKVSDQMPYKDLEMKRLADRARERPRTARPNLEEPGWLATIVRLGNFSAGSAWAPYLANEMAFAHRFEDGYKDTASYLRRVAAGKIKPRAATAWKIGEALHDCGVEWCAGWVTIYCAGAYVELVDFITAVSLLWAEGSRGGTRPHVERAAEIALGVVSLLENGVAKTVAETPDLLARTYDAEAFDAAWKAVTAQQTSILSRQPIDLRIARAFGEAPDLGTPERTALDVVRAARGDNRPPADYRRRAIAERLFQWVERYQYGVLDRHRGVSRSFLIDRAYDVLRRLGDLTNSEYEINTKPKKRGVYFGDLQTET
jgi:hypothetical protein